MQNCYLYKKINKKKPLILFISSIILFSCSKDSATNNTVNSCALTFGNVVGSYKITAVTYQYNPQSALQDTYSTWPACKQDDIWSFNNDSLMTFTENINCNPSQLPGGFHKWVLQNDTLFFKDINGAYLAGYTIKEFNCNTMKFRQLDNLGGETITTYTRQ